VNRSLDIEINEKCSFCNEFFTRLRTLNKHIDKCNVKKTQKKNDISSTMKQFYLIEQRKRLSHKATKQLNRHMNTIVNVKDWENLIYESRKKRRRFNQNDNLSQFDVQDILRSKTHSSFRSRKTVNDLQDTEFSHQDAEHSRTQTHEH